MIWLELCLVYLKIGILGFGGGLEGYFFGIIKNKFIL